MQICRYCSKKGENSCLLHLNSPLNEQKNKSWGELLEAYLVQDSFAAETELSFRFQYFCCHFVSGKIYPDKLKSEFQRVFSTSSRVYTMIREQNFLEKCLPKMQKIKNKDTQQSEIFRCLGKLCKQCYHAEALRDRGLATQYERQKNLLYYVKRLLLDDKLFYYNKNEDFFTLKSLNTSEKQLSQLILNDSSTFYSTLRMKLSTKKHINLKDLIKTIFLVFWKETGKRKMPVTRGEQINLSDSILYLKGLKDPKFLSLNKPLSDNAILMDTIATQETNYFEEFDWNEVLGNAIDAVLEKRTKINSKERGLRREFLLHFFQQYGEKEDRKISLSDIIPILKKAKLQDLDEKRIQMELYYDKLKVEAQLLNHLIDYTKSKNLTSYLYSIARSFIRNRKERDIWVSKQLKRYKLNK